MDMVSFRKRVTPLQFAIEARAMDVACYLLDHGAKLSALDLKQLPGGVPPFLHEYAQAIGSRKERCRAATVALICARRRNRKSALLVLPRDVVVYILAKMIWQSRNSDVWGALPEIPPSSPPPALNALPFPFDPQWFRDVHVDPLPPDQNE